MVTLFTMHLLRAIPNAGNYLEFSIEEADYYPWQYGLFAESPYAIDDGHATVTDRPGWGLKFTLIGWRRHGIIKQQLPICKTSIKDQL